MDLYFKTSNMLETKKRLMRESMIDLLLMMDCTGSMRPYIYEAQ